MMRVEMAFGKADAVLALGHSSSLVRERAEERPMFMDYFINSSDRRIFPEGGGMLVRDAACAMIGAADPPTSPTTSHVPATCRIEPEDT